MALIQRGFRSYDGNHVPDYVKNENFVLNTDSLQASNLILWVPPLIGTKNGVVRDLSLVREDATSTGWGAAEPQYSRKSSFGGSGIELFAGNESVDWASPSVRLRDLPTTYDFTVSIWCQPDAVGQDAIFGWSGTDDIVFYPNDSAAGSGGVRVFWRDVGGSQINEAGSDLTGQNIHYVFRSRTSNAHEAFRNGISVGSSAATGTAGPFSTFHLGTWTNQVFDGLIWDARVYDRALSDAEVWALFDPSTRWELYYETGRVSYFVVPAAPVGGRIMSSLAASGGLAGCGGIAGSGGGLAA